MPAGNGPTLATEGLSVSYRTERGVIPAVRDVSIRVDAGEVVGLVGESGSGKTTLALGAIGYLPENGRVERGASLLRGVDLVGLPGRQLRRFWGAKIGMVSQDPQNALNPTLTIGKQLDEMGRRHLGLGRAAARRASLEMLENVQMPEPETVSERYPHQLSGGMLQRSAIAMALLTHPDVLILDEPTTALDVTTQALILDLLDDLKDEFHLAVLYITHNLGVVARFCDRVVVMYAGEVLEEASVLDLFSRPLHPYTANLLHCVPRLDRPSEGAVGEPPPGPGGRRLATMPGSLPALDALPRGCLFAPRCPLVLESCTVARPPLMEGGAGRLTACLRWPLLMDERGQREAVHDDGPAEPPAPAAAGRGASAAAAGGAGGATNAPISGAVIGPASVPDLLAVEGARKVFPGPRHTVVRAVDGVSLSFSRAQTFGLVGESGSGKTTLARLVMGLTPPTEGTMSLDGRSLAPTLSGRDRDLLRRLQMVFQSADSSLNPRRTVRQELTRPLVRLVGLDREAASQRAADLLQAVRLPSSHLDRYPGELSGGEKQRVAIARAFAAGPDLVICDEPISSLDVSVQGALLNLLLDLQEEAGTAYLFISHDLAAVQHLSHFIGVMYLGRLVEQGEAARVLAPPHHPYTEALLAAVPQPDPAAHRRRQRRAEQTSVDPPTPGGCPFSPRCPRSLGTLCLTVEPPWQAPGAPSGSETGAPGGPAPGLPSSEPSPASPPVGDVAPAAPHAIRCHIPCAELLRLTGRGAAPGDRRRRP